LKSFTCFFFLDLAEVYYRRNKNQTQRFILLNRIISLL